MKERFKHVIGLARTAPACHTNPENVTASETDLYMSEFDEINLNMFEAANDCSAGNIFDLLAVARANALKHFETDIFKGLAGSFKERRDPYFGFLGQPTYKGVYEAALPGSTQTLNIQLPALDSVIMRIKRIGFLASQNATVPVSISGNLGTVEIVATQNTPSYFVLPEPLIVPMDGRMLSFSYQVNGFQPLNNETSCGCGVRDKKLLMFIQNVLKQPAKGIILDVEISCDPRNMFFMNFERKQEIRNVIGFAVMYKTAALMVKRILNSDTISRYTLVDPEYLNSKIVKLEKDYVRLIDWLTTVGVLDLSYDECYVCKPSGNRLKITGILS